MFEALEQRARLLAAARAQVRRERVAGRLGARVPAGVTVDVEGEAVVLSGRGLSGRMAREARLLWLVVEAGDG